MNNKETLQINNTTINTNNNELASILATINNLPEAGSGEVEITLQEKTITPSTSSQEVIADSDYDGLSKVTVSAVDSSIDSDIKAINIRKGIDILGVTGTLEEYVEPNLQSKSATPKTTAQTITADSSYDGLSSVSIGAVTSSIDSNIKASNIKSGVSILGVTGTVKEGITPTGSLDITVNGTYDVTNYASANVEIEVPISGMTTLYGFGDTCTFCVRPGFLDFGMPYNVYLIDPYTGDSETAEIILFYDDNEGKYYRTGTVGGEEVNIEGYPMDAIGFGASYELITISTDLQWIIGIEIA